MTRTSTAEPAATELHQIVPELEMLWQTPVTIGTLHTLLGSTSYAGATNGRPSSARRLMVNDTAIWIPAPIEPPGEADGAAAVFELGGQERILPVYRLPYANGEPQYLDLPNWWLDALTVWQFPVCPAGPSGDGVSSSHGAQATGRASLLDHLAHCDLAPEAQLKAVAWVLRYALIGTRKRCRIGRTSLIAPSMHQSLRPRRTPDQGQSEFTQRARRALVQNAKWPTSKAAARVPCRARAAEDRMRPVSVDRGIDPVHTPDNARVRLTGHLGHGVKIDGRVLRETDEADVPLSVSTAQIPFAGYNDPRRLQMAARMQLQAQPLPHTEAPRVGTHHDLPAPPGVNLRVGYLAWNGLNHEDAWVISSSAAQKLATWIDHVRWITVRRAEAEPRVLVTEGEGVRPSKPLVRRRFFPQMLAPSGKWIHRGEEPGRPIELTNDKSVKAKVAGTVELIQYWNFDSSDDWLAGYELTEQAQASYRALICIRIREHRPLETGDKLVNRHGHKGVVAQIVPDEQMPRWHGEPLEALIDPVSVINRGNWGQLHETLAGACLHQQALHKPTPDATPSVARAVRERDADALQQIASEFGLDDGGSMPIDPPQQPGYITSRVHAPAGIQFVMRLPRSEKFKKGRERSRKVRRFDEHSRWAAWAHGLTGSCQKPPQLTPQAEQLRHLLAAAGCSLACIDGQIRLEHLDLSADPPADAIQFLLKAGDTPQRIEPGKDAESLGPREVVEALCVWDDETRSAALVFEPPLIIRHAPKDSALKQGKAIRWLPLLPASLRSARHIGEGIERTTTPHRLTAAYREVANAAQSKGRSRGHAPKLERCLHKLMREAKRLAIGTDNPSAKKAWCSRQVLGHHGAGVRAIIVPAGAGALSADEIGVHVDLVRRLLDRPDDSPDELRSAIAAEPWVWLKRDPVLHRWGLLPVRLRLTDDRAPVIRLPASLLGPLGADYDGDHVTIFRTLPLPYVESEAQQRRPSKIAWDPVLRRAMFQPAKQYHYGLARALNDDQKLERLQQALKTAGAPPWPTDEPDQSKQWARWTERIATGEYESRGDWWQIIEQHASDALSSDPGMGLRLLPTDDMNTLEAVVHGAAKPPLPEGDNARSTFARRILEGRSLDCYRPEESQDTDVIETIVIECQEAKGRVGNLCRRFLAQAPHVDAEVVATVQAITEHATQTVLSVKAGEAPVPHGDIQKACGLLLEGKDVEALPSAGRVRQEILAGGREALWNKLARIFASSKEEATFTQWLANPYTLNKLLEKYPNLSLPIDDPRAQPFLTTPGQG